MLTLTYFTLGWIAIIYLLNVAIARRIKRIEPLRAALFVSTVALIGTFGEVFAGTIYTALFGVPLWEYRIAPIHNAFTSYYSPVIWGMYGFHLYLLHGTLESWSIYSARYLALIFSIEAVVCELLFNLSHVLIFGTFVFYYLPSDLWHFTSIQALPFYLIAGAVITKTLKRFKADDLFFTLMCIALVVTLVWFSTI